MTVIADVDPRQQSGHPSSSSSTAPWPSTRVGPQGPLARCDRSVLHADAEPPPDHARAHGPDRGGDRPRRAVSRALLSARAAGLARARRRRPLGGSVPCSSARRPTAPTLSRLAVSISHRPRRRESWRGALRRASWPICGPTIPAQVAQVLVVVPRDRLHLAQSERLRPRARPPRRQRHRPRPSPAAPATSLSARSASWRREPGLAPASRPPLRDHPRPGCARPTRPDPRTSSGRRHSSARACPGSSSPRCARAARRSSSASLFRRTLALPLQHPHAVMSTRHRSRHRCRHQPARSSIRVVGAARRRVRPAPSSRSLRRRGRPAPGRGRRRRLPPLRPQGHARAAEEDAEKTHRKLQPLRARRQRARRSSRDAVQELRRNRRRQRCASTCTTTTSTNGHSGHEAGTFTDWDRRRAEHRPACSTKACTGPTPTDKVNVAKHADLLIGVVPVINLEWIQKLHRDKKHARLQPRGRGQRPSCGACRTT